MNTYVYTLTGAFLGLKETNYICILRCLGLPMQTGLKLDQVTLLIYPSQIGSLFLWVMWVSGSSNQNWVNPDI